MDIVMTCTVKLIRGLVLTGLICLPAASIAAEYGTLDTATTSVELNSVGQSQDACRLTFTVNSPTGLTRLETQTVLFDTSGGVHTFTLFDFGKVPENGLRVRQFDIPQTQCDTVGLVLFNEVSICTQTDAATCKTSPKFTSRVETVEVQQ
jgi:hypothetical protein